MANTLVNFYVLLGVEPEVSASEIKNAYRRLAKNHHPDFGYHDLSDSERTSATEFMMCLNEAYETLADKTKRAAYDSQINRIRAAAKVFHESDEGEHRELYVRQIFTPSRSAIVKVITKYKQQLVDLSQDIYDEQLLAEFEKYVNEVEVVLRRSSTALSSRVAPGSLNAAVQMMRYCIAQAVDALDELQRFCQNFDYDHLHMAQNLFRESMDLSRKALELSKSNRW